MAEKDSKRVETFSPKRGECAVCGKVGTLKCSRCRVDFYCSKEHQAQAWPRHRKNCGSIELRVSPEVGRCVVATKDIPAGTVLMREVPLVATPNFCVGDERELVCVGCFMPPQRVRPCAKCGWPVCGEECSKMEIHQPECAAFQRAKFKLPKRELSDWDPKLWCHLAALRTTLAFEDESRRELLESLQYKHESSSLEDINALAPAGRVRLMMKNVESEQACQSTAKWVRGEARMKWLGAEKVLRAAGACFVNATACVSSSGRHVTGLFAGMSMLQHSCRPNVETLVWDRVGDPDPMAGVASSMEYVLVATRDIARGEHLGLGYKQSFLLGASKRRYEMLNYNFLCRCELCSDPSQRGLHLEGWCCRPCSAKKQKAVPVLIHDLDNTWACGDCGDKGQLATTGTEEGDRAEVMMNMFSTFMTRGPMSLMDMARNPATMFDTLAAPGGDSSPYAQAKGLEQRLNALLGSPSKVPLKEWERFIADALWPRGPLHATHSLVLQAKKAIIQMDHPDALAARLPEAETRRLMDYCRDLLAVYDQVCPGASTFRTHVLFIHSRLLGALVNARLNEIGNKVPPPEKYTALSAHVDEWEKMHLELLACAICPKSRHSAVRNLELVTHIRKNLSMMKSLALMKKR